MLFKTYQLLFLARCFQHVKPLIHDRSRQHYLHTFIFTLLKYNQWVWRIAWHLAGSAARQLNLPHQPAELFLFQKHRYQPRILMPLFLTIVACWIQAAEFDESSASFPSRIHSSFWAWEILNNQHLASSKPCRHFLPKKRQISTRKPFSWVTLLS